jgi:hypothetical protein
LWHEAARAELRGALDAEEASLRRAQAAADADASAGGAGAADDHALTQPSADTAAGVGAAFVTGSSATSAAASASASASASSEQQLSWNHAEFAVRYAAALGRELVVDGVFVRLLAEAAERGAPVTVRRRTSTRPACMPEC